MSLVFFFWSPPLCSDVLFVLRQMSSKIRKPIAYNPVFIALKKYKSINIFRTNDKIVIACYSYKIYLILYSVPCDNYYIFLINFTAAGQKRGQTTKHVPVTQQYS